MDYKNFIKHYINILDAPKVTDKGAETYVRSEVQILADSTGISFEEAVDNLIDIYFDQSMSNRPSYLQDKATTAATNLFFIKFMDTHRKEKKSNEEKYRRTG